MTAPDGQKEASERCASCGVLWTQHPGIQGTCAELLEARAEIERLKGELARWKPKPVDFGPPTENPPHDRSCWCDKCRPMRLGQS